MGVISLRERSVGVNNIGGLPTLSTSVASAAPTLYTESSQNNGGTTALKMAQIQANANQRNGILKAINDDFRNAIAATQTMYGAFKSQAHAQAAEKARADNVAVNDALQKSYAKLDSAILSQDENGRAVGFLAQAGNYEGAKTVAHDFDEWYSSHLEEARKELTADQFKSYKEHLDRYARSRGMDIVRKAIGTVDNHDKVSSANNVTSTVRVVTEKATIDDSDWGNVVEAVNNESYRRANNLVTDQSVRDHLSQLVVGIDATRRARFVEQVMDGTRDFTTKAEVDAHYENARQTAELHFVSEAMSSYLTPVQREEATKALRKDLDKAHEKSVVEVERRTAVTAKNNIRAEENILAQAYMDQDRDDFVLPNKEVAYARIAQYEGLDNVQRLDLRARWDKFHKTREDFLEDQKEKRGYPIKDEKGDTVWVNAASWGKTDVRLKSKWDEESIVKTNPQEALAEINAARATGNISAEDYYHIRKVAYAAMDERTGPWISKLFNGKMTDILLAKWSGKAYDAEKLDDLDLYYKRNADATSATGGFKGRHVVYPWIGSAHVGSVFDDMLDHDKKKEPNEYVFSLEEKRLLIDTIQRLSRQGLNQSQMEAAVEEIVAPKQAMYYRMTVGERLTNHDFFASLTAIGSLNEEVAAKTSAFAGIAVKRNSDTAPVKKEETKKNETK